MAFFPRSFPSQVPGGYACVSVPSSRLDTFYLSPVLSQMQALTFNVFLKILIIYKDLSLSMMLPKIWSWHAHNQHSQGQPNLVQLHLLFVRASLASVVFWSV